MTKIANGLWRTSIVTHRYLGVAVGADGDVVRVRHRHDVRRPSARHRDERHSHAGADSLGDVLPVGGAVDRGRRAGSRAQIENLAGVPVMTTAPSWEDRYDASTSRKARSCASTRIARRRSRSTPPRGSSGSRPTRFLRSRHRPINGPSAAWFATVRCFDSRSTIRSGPISTSQVPPARWSIGRRRRSGSGTGSVRFRIGSTLPICAATWRSGARSSSGPRYSARSSR